MGRPTKLTPEVAEVILKAVEHGVPDKYAARAAGIHPATLIDWKNRGERERSAELDPDDHTKKALLAIARDRDITVATSWTKAQIAAEINSHQSPYAEFSESLREAEARFLKMGMEEILKLSLEARDWRGILALLERRFPEIMGRISPRHLEDFDEMADATGAGTAEDADRMLERADEIRIKMLEAG